MSYLPLILLLFLTIYFIWEMKYQLHRSNLTNRLIATYLDDIKSPMLIDEIFDHCTHDRKLSPVMKKNDATKDDIQNLFKKLLLWGNFKKGRRFVPINSFFHVYSLNYLLKHKDADAKELTMKMMNFFHI